MGIKMFSELKILYFYFHFVLLFLFVEEILYLNPNHNVTLTERDLICKAGLSVEWKKGKSSFTDSTCNQKSILGLLLLFPPPSLQSGPPLNLLMPLIPV